VPAAGSRAPTCAHENLHRDTRQRETPVPSSYRERAMLVGHAALCGAGSQRHNTSRPAAGHPVYYCINLRMGSLHQQHLISTLCW
jgi:hypothetical protein